MRGIVGVLLGLIALPQALLAQDRGQDVLYVSATAQSGVGLNGAGGEVEWLRPASAATSVTAGGGATSISDIWWMYGTGGATTRHGGAIYSGRVSLGSGRWSAGPFPYMQYVGAVTLPIARGMYVNTEAQRVSLAGEAATVLKVGTLLTVSRGSTVGVAYHAAPWEPTRDRAVSVRADVNVRGVSVLGGAVASARKVAAANIQAIDLTTRIAPEYFGGCSVPVSTSQLIVSVQVAPQPPGRFVRFLVSLRHPLGDRASGSEVGR